LLAGAHFVFDSSISRPGAALQRFPVPLISESCVPQVFIMGRFFGLRGTKLNVAIGVIAGLDFL
jgi:hypothetical protein